MCIRDYLRGVSALIRWRRWLELLGYVQRTAPAAWRDGMNVGDKAAAKSGTVLGTIVALAGALAFVCEKGGPFFRAIEALDKGAIVATVGLFVAALGTLWAVIRGRAAIGRGNAEVTALRGEVAALRVLLEKGGPR